MNLPQIVDGFSYNDQLIDLPYRSFPRMLEKLEVLRRAANFRVKEFCVPDNQSEPIQPFDTFYDQINIAGGSYFWGYNFAAISATFTSFDTETQENVTVPVDTSATDLLVQMVDSCTGIPIWQDFVNCGAVRSNENSRCRPVIVFQPRLILEPGLVNIEISNRTPNAITCQFRLRFAESCRVQPTPNDPCELVSDIQQARANLMMGLR